jgi:hypothetical protein
MIPNLDDILSRAAEDHAALIDAAHSPHLTDASVLLIALRAVRASIEDWEHDNGCNCADILPALLDGAVNADR